MPLKVLRFALFSVFAAIAGWLSVRLWLAPDVQPTPPRTVPGQATWFERARPHCNTVEVETFVRRDPPDLETFDGVSYAAACYALAGKTDVARDLIFRLQPNDRYRAAGVVFDVGHPVADMGDDRSAGPIMELVAFFWPNHYMALYHAGASAYQLGHYARATQYLESFVQTYRSEDGWTTSARGMLKRMRDHPKASPQPVEDPHG